MELEQRLNVQRFTNSCYYYQSKPIKVLVRLQTSPIHHINHDHPELLPDSPIGCLILLVEGDTGEFLHEVLQIVLGHSQMSHRSSRVKHIHTVDAEVALQPLHVAVTAVQHLTNREDKNKTSIE